MAFTDILEGALPEVQKALPGVAQKIGIPSEVSGVIGAGLGAASSLLKPKSASQAAPVGRPASPPAPAGQTAGQAADDFMRQAPAQGAPDSKKTKKGKKPKSDEAPPSKSNEFSLKSLRKQLGFKSTTTMLAVGGGGIAAVGLLAYVFSRPSASSAASPQRAVEAAARERVLVRKPMKPEVPRV